MARPPDRVARPLAWTLALWAFAGAARAEVIHVGPGLPFASVAQGVAHVSPGGTVRIHAGIYREHLVVSKALVLEGEEGAVLDGGGAGTVLEIRAANVHVRRLRVTGSGVSFLTEDAGIKALRAPGCVIGEVTVEDALFGILVRESPDSRVAGCHVTGKDLPMPRRGDGIRVHVSARTTVEDNQVLDSRDLVIWQSDDCQVRRNRVRGCRYGLHYMYCDRNLFEDNVFEGNQTGAAIMYSRNVTLRRNLFADSDGPSAHGLLVKVADGLRVEHNWFLNNDAGLFLEESPSSAGGQCVFTGNVIAGNRVGVTMEPSVAGAQFTGNVFAANGRAAEAPGRVREDRNLWSPEGRGNYWSGYAGFDADRDGVGDTPHRVDGVFDELARRCPGAEVLRMSPAAAALEEAARAFPIFQPPAVLTDGAPLLAPPAGVRPPPRRVARGTEPWALGALALAGGILVGALRAPGAAP